MYKDKADGEEYLLGRRIDKTMVVEEETPATGTNQLIFDCCMVSTQNSPSNELQLEMFALDNHFTLHFH